MRSHDYTQEVGLRPTDRRAPLPVTIAALALVLAVGIFFVKEVCAQPTHQVEAPAPAASH